ncbi:succinylglutamate desuccinylase/aspartoacylase family protein [Spongiimicrobium salis]|uniref:succinylglutamate desuccinylase/aspartoacylase family protein n=1 Tax=Spongiimicrobium salis TaxID=1667022 RepID=UPI00374D4ED5
MNKIIFGIIFLLIPSWVTAQDDLQGAYESETRPLRKDIRIEFKDAQNNRTFLPVVLLKGKKKGPVFTMVAGVHGFEYPPIVATQELLKEIRLDDLAGTLVILPIANTASFYSRTPFMNPQDKVNLNNAFPGKSNGSVTQKIAHYIHTKVIPMSDVFLDIHGGDASEDLLPFICYYNNENYPEQTKMAKALSENSGFEYVVSYAYTLKAHDPAKYVFKQACKDGKVALSIESGKLGNVQEEAVRLIKNGVYNMLHTMNMYPKVTQTSNQKLIPLNNQKYLRADRNGIFYSRYKAGDKVERGAVVGYITDEFGTKISTFKAPVSGTILYKVSTPPVNIDDTLMCISFLE